MMLHTICVCFILLTISAVEPSIYEDIHDIYLFIKTGLHIAELVDESEVEHGPKFPPFRGNREKALLAQISQVSQKIDRLGDPGMQMARATIDELGKSLSAIVGLELRMHDLSKLMSRVIVAHERRSRYLARGGANLSLLERRTLIELADSAVSHGSESIRSALDHIHELVRPGGWDLFEKLRRSMVESNSNICSFQQSPQQIIYNLYNSIALTELKGYAMMQFSWMLLRLYEKGNFTVESEVLQETFEERALEKLQSAAKTMAKAKRHLWRCDPILHTEGETYVQLTKLLQGQIQNEVDMNNEHTCRENCQYYTYAKNNGCYDGRVCNKLKQCSGKLHDCKYIDSDMWVCPGDDKRRFRWVEYENGRVLGTKDTCPASTFKVDSWWRYLFWHCSYCFCLCDEPGPNSDRYFNLRPVLADISNNMVVTGLKFVKHNRVIHLIIQEGSLLPKGGINATSLRWKPPAEYRITQAGIHNGVDYHTLSWEQRAIDLDDLEAPADHVLTGVRFRQVGTHLNFEIMVTPINFTSGSLVKPNEQSRWISNDNTDASDVTPRTQLMLQNTDVSTKSHVGSQPDSKSDQFLLFTHTDMNIDGAQTTVPFLDAQPVEPHPPILLSGAGIYHKGTKGYGGFVAPKIITYDYTRHLELQVTKSPS